MGSFPGREVVMAERNDILGDVDAEPEENNPAIPAATVVLARDGRSGLEILMLHRTSRVHFGGMWVFPGGRIDPDDYAGSRDVHAAARNAAARETMEETGLIVDPAAFVHFAHWTPPPSTPRRYATWFFATEVAQTPGVEVDGTEIQDHRWIHPGEMLSRHGKGEVDLAPPTWVTLYHLARHAPASTLISTLDAQPARNYETHAALRADGIRVTMWVGDAGYETLDADLPGPRHRLVLHEGAYEFENTVEIY